MRPRLRGLVLLLSRRQHGWSHCYSPVVLLLQEVLMDEACEAGDDTYQQCEDQGLNRPCLAPACRFQPSVRREILLCGRKGSDEIGIAEQVERGLEPCTTTDKAFAVLTAVRPIFGLPKDIVAQFEGILLIL